MIVVDSDVISYCWLKSERTDAARKARSRDGDGHSPVLFLETAVPSRAKMILRPRARRLGADAARTPVGGFGPRAPNA